jgi:hypothetical protein
MLINKNQVRKYIKEITNFKLYLNLNHILVRLLLLTD